MASNPMLQAVLLWQNHQTTTPYFPIKGVPIASLTGSEPIQTADMAEPKERKEPKEEEEEEENDEENGENNGETEEGEESNA